MISQFSQYPEILFCGGGAKSPALKAAIEKKSCRRLLVLENAQFVVAYGAAISKVSKVL
jgi:activator of 2-hydroxyglutaryl-CoA dehydratase